MDEAALNLLRRMPPADLATDLRMIAALVPDIIEDILADVDQPLKVETCPESKKRFLKCDYNRDADSFRSPWSNEYVPALPEGTKPSDRLREMELKANDIFSSYREAYFEGGISSVYFWDLDEGFACAVLIKKEAEGGGWDSIHVVEVQEGAKASKYKQTSTIMLSIASKEAVNLDICGALTRQNETELDVNDVQTHIVNIGNVVQEMENKLRNSVDQVYFGKAQEINSLLRSAKDTADVNKQVDLVAALKAQLAGKK
eukprot:NODE_1357_length_948_cov_28.156841_g1047_i0.p1 GENE.NODE_1357_length_948_cov_28.156841_g1047_i0~~NODE_1357_length_948_cov_28.156841_g1047_i0.p1  ORF type:complete len:258 (-),score=66.10 NODE_1357_length_948_cov_28.156841_g1047_i0:123-896(-)